MDISKALLNSEKIVNILTVKWPRSLVFINCSQGRLEIETETRFSDVKSALAHEVDLCPHLVGEKMPSDGAKRTIITIDYNERH